MRYLEIKMMYNYTLMIFNGRANTEQIPLKFVEIDRYTDNRVFLDEKNNSYVFDAYDFHCNEITTSHTYLINIEAYGYILIEDEEN